MDSLQRSSESYPQHGWEAERTIKRTFMGQPEVGNNNNEWPTLPQPVVETASGGIKGTNEGRRDPTVTV